MRLGLLLGLIDAFVLTIPIGAQLAAKWVPLFMPVAASSWILVALPYMALHAPVMYLAQRIPVLAALKGPFWSYIFVTQSILVGFVLGALLDLMGWFGPQGRKRSLRHGILSAVNTAWAFFQLSKMKRVVRPVSGAIMVLVGFGILGLWIIFPRGCVHETVLRKSVAPDGRHTAYILSQTGALGSGGYSVYVSRRYWKWRPLADTWNELLFSENLNDATLEWGDSSHLKLACPSCRPWEIRDRRDSVDGVTLELSGPLAVPDKLPGVWKDIETGDILEIPVWCCGGPLTWKNADGHIQEESWWRRRNHVIFKKPYSSSRPAPFWIQGEATFEFIEGRLVLKKVGDPAEQRIFLRLDQVPPLEGGSRGGLGLGF